VKLLAIDTSMGASSAAVLVREGGSTRLYAPAPISGRDQAEHFIPLIESVLAEAGIRFAALTALAVTVGPGSFSGVRTGLAAVKGFQLALRLPVFTATSLELMAYACRRAHVDAVAIAAPAGRDYVFCQCFSATGELRTVPQALPVSEALREIPEDVRITGGQSAALLAEAAGAQGRRLIAVMPDLTPCAKLLAEFAAAHPEGERPPLSPLYLRPPDAKPQQSKILPHAGTDTAGR
jgi:tRNA threonylcarbamoyladenosine biosynthesis protein TsaB